MYSYLNVPECTYIISPKLKGGPEPSNFEDVCLVNVNVKYFSKNYVLVPLKFNLNWNVWKPFLKSSPLDFSGQRLWKTSLVVFLWFHSFSLVVKWPEFSRVYITNILRFYNVNLAQLSEHPLHLQEFLGSHPVGNFLFWHVMYAT